MDSSGKRQGDDGGEEPPEAKRPRASEEVAAAVPLTCSICIEESRPDNRLIPHRCPTCVPNAWSICETCDKSITSRQCPLCRSSYAGMVLHKIPITRPFWHYLLHLKKELVLPERERFQLAIALPVFQQQMGCSNVVCFNSTPPPPSIVRAYKAFKAAKAEKAKTEAAAAAVAADGSGGGEAAAAAAAATAMAVVEEEEEALGTLCVSMPKEEVHVESMDELRHNLLQQEVVVSYLPYPASKVVGKDTFVFDNDLWQYMEDFQTFLDEEEEEEEEEEEAAAAEGNEGEAGGEGGGVQAATKSTTSSSSAAAAAATTATTTAASATALASTEETEAEAEQQQQHDEEEFPYCVATTLSKAVGTFLQLSSREGALLMVEMPMEEWAQILSCSFCRAPGGLLGGVCDCEYSRGRLEEKAQEEAKERERGGGGK